MGIKGSQSGDVESQNNIGLAYENGDGVAKDPVLAKEWFEKAANNGFVLGQYNLALKYFDGTGVEQNFSKSIEYAEKAANAQNKDAIQLLVDIYSNERNPEYNPEKANYWKSKI